VSAYLTLFAMMVVAHALFDYPLQGDFLSKAKNRANPIPGVPWYQAMAAHSIIQGGAVWFLTGSIWLGLAEAWCHFCIDDMKCRNRIGFNEDQAFHIGCKALWAFVMIA
jgi:hypothetical protein